MDCGECKMCRTVQGKDENQHARKPGERRPGRWSQACVDRQDQVGLQYLALPDSIVAVAGLAADLPTFVHLQ